MTNGRTGRGMKENAAELTRWMVHKHYCENDVEAVIALMDDDILWTGAGENEFAAGKTIVSGIFRTFAGKVPKCSISDEEYHVLQVAPETFLCSGRMWIATDASTQISLRVHQRITTMFRWVQGQLRCCHIHISNPYEDMVDGDVGFPSKIAQESFQYLQEQIATQKQKIDEQVEQLRQVSYKDGLTGLYNRNKFNQILKTEAADGGIGLGVACFDLNELKQINDQMGHIAGDDLIRGTADQIRRIFEGKAYRIGGDKFVVIDDTLEEREFQAAVQAVKRGLEAVQISCAVGSSWRRSHCSVEEQYEEADRQMYQEKRRYYKQQKETWRGP